MNIKVTNDENRTYLLEQRRRFNENNNYLRATLPNSAEHDRIFKEVLIEANQSVIDMIDEAVAAWDAEHTNE